MAEVKKRRRVGQVELSKLLGDDEVVRLREQLLEQTSELADLEKDAAEKREAKIETAVQLHDLGLPPAVIADIGNVTTPAVYKWLERAGREV